MMRAKRVHYINNNHIHFNTVKDTVGEDGIAVAGVQTLVDQTILNTHQLDHGFGIGRFHPDFKIATAWQRLEAGTHTEADLLIFRHEHFESRFEGIFKTDYKTAHDAANRAGRPSGLRNDFDITEVKYGNVYRDQKN